MTVCPWASGLRVKMSEKNDYLKPEDEGSALFRNVEHHSPKDTVSEDLNFLVFTEKNIGKFK
jgi:hypothetical protein